jgi:hypothetical protein
VPLTVQAASSRYDRLRFQKFIYLFEAEIPSKFLEMLENLTLRAEHTALPTISCRKIPFEPYDSFQQRIITEVLDSHPRRRHEGTDINNTNASERGIKRRLVEDGGDRCVRQKV